MAQVILTEKDTKILTDILNIALNMSDDEGYTRFCACCTAHETFNSHKQWEKLMKHDDTCEGSRLLKVLEGK